MSNSAIQIDCFFLHARAHSSGLNLTNATHVFLCEPLINTAIELQAIARVHRIGQPYPTTVWMYLVEDTVEESIYEVSVTRRLSHFGLARHHNDVHVDEDTGLGEDDVEAANSLEIQAASLATLLAKGSGGGEEIDTEDLWSCLFSSRSGTAASSGAYDA